LKNKIFNIVLALFVTVAFLYSQISIRFPAQLKIVKCQDIGI